MSTKNTVLVAGVHGVTGRAAAEHWASLPGTKVYGLSRRSDPIRADVEGISADLLDRDDLQRKLGKSGGITHIVFGAYIERPSAAERSQANVAILKNLLEVVEETSPTLRHVTFYQGGKAYGADLGRRPAKTTRGSCHGGLSPRATAGQGVALDRAAPGYDNRLWRDRVIP
jgi:nucleoside-diphosphate-sugar epimerase